MYSLIYVAYRYLSPSTTFHTADTENKAANRTCKTKAFMQLYVLAAGGALTRAQVGYDVQICDH